MLYMIGGIIYLRDQRGEQRHHDADHSAQRHCESDEPSVLINGFLKLACAEELADDYGNGIAHREEGAEEEIRDCGRNIDRRDDLKPAHGITLVEHCHAA